MPTIDLSELRQRRARAPPTVQATAPETMRKRLHRGGLAAWEWLCGTLAYAMMMCRAIIDRLTAAPPPPPLGLRVVLISDTHGCHRQLTIPDGDVLIHGGDFTRSGLLEDAEDFNKWLGELGSTHQFQHKIVINGNHESTASWKGRMAELLSNATFLREEAVEIGGGGAVARGRVCACTAPSSRGR